MSMNEPILYVNGQFVPKSQAVISVYDSGFQHGDGVYEGIRVYKGRVFMLDEHIERLYESAKAIELDIGIPREQMKSIVLETIRRNSLRDALHIRLQVTRGRKRMTGMNPKYNEGTASIVICLDAKKPIFDQRGVTLITSKIIRCTPRLVDPKIHSLNQLHQILAAIEANRQGADEAIMLDPQGFVAETNGTTIFMVKDGALLTPTVDYILVGITRKLVLNAARKLGIPTTERNLSLSEFYNAEEVFICGTVGEICPVEMIDGLRIGESVPGAITAILRKAFAEMTEHMGVLVDDA